jgi:uncharacterized SAM-binding protein YcdF (DUF218 family)
VFHIFHAIVEVLIPPASLPVLAILGGLFARRRRRAGRALSILAVVGLFVLSLPDTARLLVWPLEQGLPLVPPAGRKPGAIVILGGDVAQEADGRVTAGALSLERLRAGARLARKTRLPILVTGGPLGPGQPPIAELMAHSLARDFSTPAAWIEPAAKNTWQNARLSEAILLRHHIDSIYVVTQAWHMRRALIAFAPLSLTVTAAPTLIDPPPSLAWHNFVPRVAAWQMSYFALHEWIGCAYYELREW